MILTNSHITKSKYRVYNHVWNAVGYNVSDILYNQLYHPSWPLIWFKLSPHILNHILN
jgi:hypothetical protein